MSADLKPVVFKIVLDTADARRQLDALAKGTQGKGGADARGVPAAPKPTPGAAGKTASPGSGMPSPISAAAPRGGAGSAALGGFIGSVNRAVLNPIGAAEGAATGLVGTAVTAAQAAVILVGSAVFLERVVPLILDSLAEFLPDMPFFKDYAKSFDEMISDKITEVRTWVAALIPTIQETATIDRAILQAGGTLDAANTLELGKSLFEINRQTKRFDADIEKELDKVVFKGLMKSLVAGMGG